AVALREGLAVEKAFRASVNELPEEDKKGFHLDAETAGQGKLHRVDVHRIEGYAKNHRGALGNPPLFVAFRAAAAFFAVGEDAVPALRQAVAEKSQKVSGIEVGLALQRLASPALAGNSSPAPKIAREVFGKEANSDQVRLTLQGGKSLRVRVEAK